MTTIRCEFPTIESRSNFGIEGSLRASRMTATVITLTVPGDTKVVGHESREDREAMYAAMFGEA